MTRLGNYLNNIAKGKPINFRLFLESVPDVYRSQPSRYFTSRKVGKGHIVTVIDEVVWAALKRQAVSPEDRIEAAMLGDSHRARLDETFVLAFHALCPGKIPDVVYLSQQQGSLQRFRNQRTLLLLENEKNFFGYPAMFRAMDVMMGVSLSLNDTDVAFAQGKKCTSELVMDWLNQYDAIFFAGRPGSGWAHHV